MKKIFIGRVKPHLKVEGLRLEIAYGQEVALEDWQVNHPHFIYARKNGWVVSKDDRTIAHPVASKNSQRMSFTKWACEVPVHQDFTPARSSVVMDEKAVKKVLEDQAQLIKNIQQSHDSLKNKAAAPPPQSNTAYLEHSVAQIQEQQKMILDLLSRSQQDRTADTLTAIFNEIKQLNLTAVAPPAITVAASDNSKIEEMFEKLNENLAKSGSVSKSTAYNKGEEKQSNIADFEERFVPKIGNFDVKNSNVVAQESSSESVDNTLAILKSLKKPKGK